LVETEDELDRALAQAQACTREFCCSTCGWGNWTVRPRWTVLPLDSRNDCSIQVRSMNGNFLSFCFAALLSAPATVASAPGERPNILYCLADDWGWPHSKAYGDRTVRTPTFERVAREGILFTHAFSAAPSCTPSEPPCSPGNIPINWRRAATYGAFCEEIRSLYGPAGASGVFRRLDAQGLGPGNFQAGGYIRNPAGTAYRSFSEFLAKRPPDKPFCFWFGSNDPHRPYERGSGNAKGLQPDQVRVPAYCPTMP